MKTLKRTISSVMVLFLLISSALFLMPAKQVNAATLNHTRDEAVAWCKSLIGKDGEDLDNAGGETPVKKIQCVDLIIKYSRWLGKDLGSSHAYQYGTKSIPTDYYKRYKNGETTPQPGDIFVWMQNSYGALDHGHVGVIYAVDSSNYYFIDYAPSRGNTANARGPKSNTKKGIKQYDYLIRPNFRPGTLDPAPTPSKVANIKDGTYMLKNVASNYAMNWAYGESSNPLWLAKYGDEVDKEQHFKFVHTGSGKYKIESAHQSGKVVNCNCGLPVTAGVNVNVWSYSNNDTQKFYVTPMGNGQYLLQSASNPQLVIGAPSTNFHAKLEIQNYSKGNKSQLWSFDPNPAIPTYTITASSVSNGKVSLSKTSAKEGEEITVTATPNTGYTLDTIKVNGSAISGKTFKMPAKNTTVEVTFKKIVYKITLGSISNGSASLSKTTGSIGDQITVTTNPANGYELNWIKYNGNAVSGNKFTMPAADVTVTVNFKRKDAPALGTTATVGNFIYKVTDASSDGTGTVTLIGVAKQTETVSIPATIEINAYKYIVNRIGTNAFKNDKTLKTLYITENIRFIDNCAFYGCSNLVKVSGGAKLEIIGQSAFINCTKLKTFVITSTVLRKIGPTAFYGDKALKTIYVKNTVKLTKAGVKKSLKGSKVKTVKVKKSKVKAYKKIFKKKNSGRKVKVKK